MEKVLQQNVGAGEDRGRHFRKAGSSGACAGGYAGDVPAQAQAEARLLRGGLPGK